MEKRININIGSEERVKEFVETISGIECDFDILFGKTALEAKYYENIKGLDMEQPRSLVIHGEEDEIDKAVKALEPYWIKNN